MQALLAEHLQLDTPMAPVSLQQLQQLSEPIILLDVRPADEFAAGHIPSAINVPIDQLADNLPAITDNATIVVYCRGPYCLWSQQAVETLQAQGFQAKRLAQGYPDWQAQDIDANAETPNH